MKKITLSALFLGCLFISACGQKGPLILDKVPTDKTQAPLKNSNDVIPVKEQTELESE